MTDPITFHQTQTPITSTTHTHTLSGTSQGVGLMDGVQVRRLTPRECERLMGWPDDHTRYRADGGEVADSTRYRMCGNGVAAPVAEWLGAQLRHALEHGDD
jgi:DNA (cytosine-5)-methyltransferase 1